MWLSRSVALFFVFICINYIFYFSWHPKYRMMGKNRKRRHDGEPEMELMYQENFVVVDIPGKGKGVRALTKIKKGTALFEYEGTVLTMEPDLEDDTYVFEVNHKGKKFWIDATLDVNCLGRYLNDETAKPNVRAVKKVNLSNDIPTVIFYAIKDIDELDELTYNYGPGQYEWRKTGKKKNRVKVSEEVSEDCREMEGDETKEAFIKVIKKGTEEERFFKLSKLTHIGRSPDCDIVFNRQDIMPVQCKLHLMCNHVLLEDLSKKRPHRFSTLVNCSEFYVEDRLFTVTYMSQNTENNLKQKVIHEQESDSEMYDDSGESWVPPSESEVSDIEDMWILKHENSDSDSDGDANKTDIGLSLGEPRSETNDTGEETSGLNSISEIIPVIGNKIPKAMVVQQPFHKSKKTHCCFFCEKMFSRISRHYEQVHSNETDVARILALTKKSKERKHMWASLVNKGNFNHNYEVIKKGRGVIIAKYCPRKGVEKDTSMYLPCSLCLGIYSKNDLWRHQKTCTANCKRENIESESKRLRGKPIQDGKLLLPPKGTEQFYEHILSKMRDDEVKKIVESDQLIMNFGEKLFEKVGTKVHQHQYVSQRLRELARLILEMREFKINDLETSLQPLNWEKIILGVRKVAGFDTGTDRYKIPTLCLKIGHSLQKCAKILKTKAIIQQDDEKKNCASSFLELYSSEWTTSISSKAHNTLHHLKFNKPSYLPLAEDVLRLNSFLNQKAHDLYSKEVNVKNYCDFAEVVLAQIVLFNRKRSGEVQRITVKDIEKSIQGKNFNVTSELKEALSPFERELCLTHDRVEIVGKRGSRVPILLTQSMKQYLIHLVENRNKVGVKDTQHLFIKPGSKYPIRGCDCLRRFAVECGAKYPGSLTSTKLRKHLATMTQILGLDEGNQDILAKFMGHDIRVHRNFYRLPEQTIELAKVSKVLHLINSGKIAKYRGMDFNDIVFNQDELCDEDDESETDDEENTNDSSHSSDVDNAHINRDDYSENESKPKKRKFMPRSWSTPEKKVVIDFTRYIKQQKLPGKADCIRLIKENTELKERTWIQVKNFVRNKITCLKKFQDRGKF